MLMDVAWLIGGDSHVGLLRIALKRNLAMKKKRERDKKKKKKENYRHPQSKAMRQPTK